MRTTPVSVSTTPMPFTVVVASACTNLTKLGENAASADDGVSCDSTTAASCGAAICWIVFSMTWDTVLVLSGYWFMRETVTMPVASDVTNDTRSPRSMSCCFVRSSMQEVYSIERPGGNAAGEALESMPGDLL